MHTLEAPLNHVIDATVSAVLSYGRGRTQAGGSRVLSRVLSRLASPEVFPGRGA